MNRSVSEVTPRVSQERMRWGEQRQPWGHTCGEADGQTKPEGCLPTHDAVLGHEVTVRISLETTVSDAAAEKTTDGPTISRTRKTRYLRARSSRASLSPFSLPRPS